MKAEVTMFFNDDQKATEYFDASCHTELAAIALEKSKRANAAHFNCGLATDLPKKGNKIA